MDPWDGVFVLGVTLALYAVVVLSATLIILWDGSYLSLAIGVPSIGASAAVAGHMVPRRALELVQRF